MSEYSEKFKDPRWQKRRLEVFESAEFKCEDCGSETKQLHAHHLRYVKGREPWEYEDCELRCLCDKCHQDWHVADDWLRLLICGLTRQELIRVGVYAAGILGLKEEITEGHDVSLLVALRAGAESAAAALGSIPK